MEKEEQVMMAQATVCHTLEEKQDICRGYIQELMHKADLRAPRQKCGGHGLVLI